jgi:hypothetical protein
LAPLKVAVTLDKERHLVANLNTLHKFYEKTGHQLWDCPMWKAGKDIRIAEHTDDIWAMTWAFLWGEDHSLTYEHVGDLLGNFDLMEMFAKCAEAYALTAPHLTEAQKNALQSLDPGTG